MSKSSHLRVSDLRALFRLTGECRDLGDDPGAWRSHWLSSLGRLVGAHLASGGEMELTGGAPKIAYSCDWGWENGFDRDAYLRSVSQVEGDLSGELLFRAYFGQVKPGETPRCHSRTDLITDREWYASVDYATQHQLIGVDHTLLCFQSLPRAPGVWNSLLLNRERGCKRDFSPRTTASLTRHSRWSRR